MWLWLRRDVNKTLVPVLAVLMLACCYKTLLLDTITHVFSLGAWTALFYKAVTSAGLGLVTLQLYVGVTANDKY